MNEWDGFDWQVRSRSLSADDRTEMFDWLEERGDFRVLYNLDCGDTYRCSGYTLDKDGRFHSPNCVFKRAWSTSHGISTVRFRLNDERLAKTFTLIWG